jgi:hypothetical protein
MKNLLLAACSLFVLWIPVGCDREVKDELTSGEFDTPPVASGIYTWWHWLDNAITREGITRDLEAMKQQGIAGATILNIGLFDERDMGVPPVIFGTDEWYEMFRWAVQEANRLGLTIGAHNCDGWSTSGGPWITPGMSMKQITWSSSHIRGGHAVDTVLTRPYGVRDYYEDAFVVAYPSVNTPNSFRLARPMVKINNDADGNLLHDGNPFSTVNLRNDASVVIAFSESFVAEKIAVHLRIRTSWRSLRNILSNFEIRSSDDGKHYRHLTDFEIPGVNETYIIDIPQTRAKYFMIALKKPSEKRQSTSVNISEIELLKKDEHPSYAPSYKYHLEKIVTTRPIEFSDIFIRQPLSYSGSAVPSSGVIDLSANMDASGRLQWDAPEGDWTIIRFGYTTTGVENGPATKAGTGLECDKMDTAALNLHFRSYPKKLIETAGEYTGNTFRYLFIDSWECNYQNWTKNFAAEFESRRGYSLIPWIPVLCGETENSTEETEAFLHDFRTTIADLIEENYFRHFAVLCHQEGMDLHAEVIYGGDQYPPLDILRSNSYVDVPMWEFWTGQDQDGFVHYSPVESTPFDKPMYASVLYDKSIVPAEAYTGFAHYSESPWDLKLYGDRAFCSGINRMVLHSYVHQPTEKQPGMTLGQFASHFNRHNNWWDHVSGWFTFQARVQYVLQKGQVLSDILYFIGDLMPEYQPVNDQYAAPYGYNIQLCNRDILFNHTRVEDGLIKTGNGLAYRILLLPDYNQMELSTLQGIAALVREGATILGPKPLSVVSYNNREQNNIELKELADMVWGKADGKTVFENTYGKGRVIWGKPLKTVLEEANIQPDLEVLSNDSLRLLFIHKKIGNSDAYFLVNQQDQAVQTECIFRISGRAPEIWNPEDGTDVRLAVYREENGRTRLPLRFQPKESIFVMFSDDIQQDHIVAIRHGETQIFPLTDPPDPDTYVPQVILTGNTWSVYSDISGEYTVSSVKGKEYTVTTDGNEALPVDFIHGDIQFADASNTIRQVQIEDFRYWTDFSDPEIRYFSGKAKYTVHFTVPENIAAGDSLVLSAGKIKATAEIRLNGNKLGYAWMPFQRFNITGLLVPGENTLEAEVANVYRNRLIGDLAEYGEVRNLWTTSPVEQFLNKDMKLQESGIAGPVTLVRIKPSVIAASE